MVIEMANTVAFNLLALLNFNIVNAEAARPLERKNSMLNLSLSRIRSEYPG